MIPYLIKSVFLFLSNYVLLMIVSSIFLKTAARSLSRYSTGTSAYGRSLSADAIRSVSAKVFDAAGVRCAPGCRRGTHLFRRTVATAMLGSGADRSVIAAALGHSSPVTAERYIAADVEGLRRRAIDVSGFPVAEGALS